uniref:Ig-like domain-containing protein n=1 Tax=Vombatus ursinus TaxID=29139 RepID=A0A4X2LN00_VOMUR
MDKYFGISFMILYFHLDWVSSQDEVKQSLLSLRVLEGESATLNCSYKVSDLRNLQWYRQYPGQGPRVLFTLFSTWEEKWKGRLKASLDKKEAFSSLHVNDTQPEDSATYFCAVETQ